jgi:ankyrin repeat protein
VDARDSSGATPLEEALRFRNATVVEILLKQRATPGGPEEGARRLQQAVLRGETEIVRLLMDQGFDPKARSADGSTLVHDAALKGHVEVLRLLLDRGADANARNDAGATPLHDAALGGHLGAAGLLIDRGADVNVRDAETGATPLYRAASWGRLGTAVLLVDKGADVNTATRAGLTPLRTAIDNGHAELAAMLRRHGAKE